MKKQMKVILIFLILIIIGIGAFFIFRNKEPNYSDIKIVFSDLSISTEEKNITISNQDSIKKINEMCKKFESGKNDDVATAIINNYVVTLGNGTTIYMDSTIPNYGYVKYTNSEELEFVRLPEGLFNYIKELVETN